MQEPEPLTPEGFASLVPVSRETLARLDTYLGLLNEWQRTMNLVAASTLRDPWRRHILDSAQLWPLWPGDARHYVDLGSGAGLPGLVLAIMGASDTHLVESDQRKAGFLREAARVCGVGLTVHAVRAEAMPRLTAQVVTARALAPLPKLLGYVQRFTGPGSVCLLLKGRQAEAELTEARRSWTMQVEQRPSLSDSEGRILIIRDIARAKN